MSGNLRFWVTFQAIEPNQPREVAFPALSLGRRRGHRCPKRLRGGDQVVQGAVRVYGVGAVGAFGAW